MCLYRATCLLEQHCESIHHSKIVVYLYNPVLSYNLDYGIINSPMNP
jgi:hypothetical protein